MRNDNQSPTMMNNEFDLSNNQEYVVEVISVMNNGSETIDVCVISNEADLQEFNELVSEYKANGNYVGYQII